MDGSAPPIDDIMPPLMLALMVNRGCRSEETAIPERDIESLAAEVESMLVGVAMLELISRGMLAGKAGDDGVFRYWQVTHET